MMFWSKPFVTSVFLNFVLSPGAPATNSHWALNWNLMKIISALIIILMNQSWHNFAHVMTAHDMFKIVTMAGSLFFTRGQYEFL